MTDAEAVASSDARDAASMAIDPRFAAPGAVLLVSCYELGHQPFAIASAWAQLEAAGFGVDGADASIEMVAPPTFARARLVAISVPMHTALRLGTALAARARAASPDAHVCFFGLYAAMNAAFLLDGVADSVIGGEAEVALVELATALATHGSASVDVAGVTTRRSARVEPPIMRRLPFVVPRRDGLPALDRYAKLIGPREGEERTVGYVEASRGCLHTCLHCPITPVYEGRFFIVPREIVLADAAQQIAAGARHITFGDPDFLNGPGHSMAVARALHEAHPEVTFDVTIKVSHILAQRERFAELARLGCVFIVSAIESLSPRVLEALDKGHTRADIDEARAIVAAAGIALRPSLVAFTPWTTADDYADLCDFIVGEGLVDHVDPIQLAIRLLVPPGSALLAREAPRPWLGPLAPDRLGFTWTHPDPRMDALHAEVSVVVDEAAQAGEDAAATFAKIRALAYRAAGRDEVRALPARERRFVPRLSEPWFCCAEPNARQMEQVTCATKPACC